MPVELPERAPILAARKAKEFRLTGWHVLAMLIAFFAVVASVNVFMMTTAIRTMPGLDARNGYDVSQNFNRQELAAAQAQARRGWQSDARVSLANRVLDLEIRFRDSMSKPLAGLAVTVVLQHPAQRGRDRAITLSPRGDGYYTAKLDGIDAGGWGLVIEAHDLESGERLFLSRHRLALKDESIRGITP
ncbi:MAG: FixH family protein [Methylobacterium sp.]|nr:FixH family protein [Methylobacterium sp.]MCA3652603.1 FixH family protein [Methylobacterium sp.]MCA3654035.1 FixH family protein [Methylobacterium sp.]MCA3658432.1 FixH family protein [Methylobacterium sp.]MCA3659964.1 FixH family protein [Methylobacterium sp.]